MNELIEKANHEMKQQHSSLNLNEMLLSNYSTVLATQWIMFDAAMKMF